MSINQYRETIYAGVLGKILGVYLGRPVEGWSYEKIQDVFGDVYYYINQQTGAPLIVPDDDISGTFIFYRALEDNGYPNDIKAEQIGDTWLNYIIEDKTILWWGGLSRSTEHTAYLRLKEGIKAPASGSTKLNGISMSEQIGAQIFIDTWAMVNPNNPKQAVRMAKEAASVSHDGIAVDAACFLAAMQSMAFEEKNMDILLDKGLEYVDNPLLEQLVRDTQEQCKKTDDWHDVRDWIAENHGYDKYPGSCPMVTNHLVIIMALIMAKDSFHESIAIATSAGWDTDCNAGNVGCLNGIRLGLEGIDAGADLRGPVKDRVYIVNSDGGECISDAVIEAKRVIEIGAKLKEEEINLAPERFTFEFPGSTQGFMLYPDSYMNQAAVSVENSYKGKGEYGLLIKYNQLAKGTVAKVSVDTYVDLQPKGIEGTSYFEVMASPSLYSTQTLKGILESEMDENPVLKMFIDYYDQDDNIKTTYSEKIEIVKGRNHIQWQIPDLQGYCIYRLGFEFVSDQSIDGEIILKTLDWQGSPENYYLRKSMEMTPALTPWTTDTTWLKAFTSTALNFTPDYTTTFSVSHPYDNGVVTTGTRDWDDYIVSSKLTLAQQESAGLVARSRGHRRYYGAAFEDGKIVILKRKDDQVIPLAAVDYSYEIDKTYLMEFQALGNKLSVWIEDELIVEAQDDEYKSGGAGFVVNQGAMLVDGFSVRSTR